MGRKKKMDLEGLSTKKRKPTSTVEELREFLEEEKKDKVVPILPNEIRNRKLEKNYNVIEYGNDIVVFCTTAEDVKTKLNAYLSANKLNLNDVLSHVKCPILPLGECIKLASYFNYNS